MVHHLDAHGIARELPFALANNLQAVIDNQPDAPGYAVADTLFPFKFGLTFPQ